MNEQLRDITLDEGYRLIVWDTNRVDTMGKSVLGYTFTDPSGTTLFEGEDFRPGMGMAIDSDESIRGLLGFLTLKPGDTDDEYFANYTPEQMAFAQGDAEQLQMYAMDDEPWPLIDTPS